MIAIMFECVCAGLSVVYTMYVMCMCTHVILVHVYSVMMSLVCTLVSRA